MQAESGALARHSERQKDPGDRNERFLITKGLEMGTVIDRQVYESAEIIDRELFISDERAALNAICEGGVPPGGHGRP